MVLDVAKENNSIWISWENHRRSRELAVVFNAKIIILTSKFPRAIRYILLSTKTLLVLLKEHPKKVYAQNPSIILATILCVAKPLFGYRLIVDRHSNFKLPTLNSKNIVWRTFHFLSKYTTKAADVTIVTNQFLKDLVDNWHGRGVILQDKLPDLNLGEKVELKGKRNIVFISTFSFDEPLQQVFDAVKMLPTDWFVYVTGNPSKYKNLNVLDIPDNVVLTGFLPEKDYQSLLYTVDALIVLTTLEHTLTCGAYEGLAFEKPMVLSDTAAIKEYFSKGVVYTKPIANDIADAVNHLINDIDKLSQDVKVLREELLVDWEKRYIEVLDSV